MELSLSPALSKEVDNMCRTCARTKANRYSLYQSIPLDTGPSKTYGELLSNLLKINPITETEHLIPQRLCSKCAKLLKNIYIFILNAQKLHEKYLSQGRYLENVVKNPDCLEETPIDLPNGAKIILDIKTETQPALLTHLNSEYLTTEIKVEQLNKDIVGEENIKKTDENSLNDLILKFEHNEETKR
uniref:ZAD domain-containing protein n=1 Tax=Glossina brevipalpis TaxID=37001 RepID=A0A1A9WDG1_9MUSC